MRRTRSETYRRRGPDAFKGSALQRVLDGASDAVNRQLRSHRGWTVVAAAAVPIAVGVIAARKRIGMHPTVTLPLGCVPPLGCAIAVPKGRPRLLAVSAAYMHLFKVGWELPYDDPEKLPASSGSTSRSVLTRWLASACRPGCGCNARYAHAARSRCSTVR